MHSVLNSKFLVPCSIFKRPYGQEFIMKLLFTLLVLLVPLAIQAQGYITKSIKDFGAKGNGRTNDQDAFVKASAFFNKRKGNGKLIIPKGIYRVGRQKFSGNDKGSIAYVGEYAIDLRACVNMIIEGQAGAILKNNDSLKIGTFSPVTGKAFKHAIKDINVKPEYAGYAANAGNAVFISGCSNIKISGLVIDGNVANFSFGGNWGIGRNAFELIHYGIYIVDANDISVNKCSIKNFACDGIYIANLGQQLKTYNIFIDHCEVNYCGRNGLSWIGGENIRVSNSVFSNSGQGTVHESPAAGISIEVENSSFCRKGYFFHCTMENNIGSAITSGSKDLATNVVFKNCTAASPVYYSLFADAASHVFEDCKFYGTVLVWYKGVAEKDAVKFRRCVFEENYRGKKMYDGTYLFGAEATGVEVDSCTFRAYTTADYYLNALTKDCSTGNTQKIQISNSSFYSYSQTGSKLGEKIAGIAGHTVFYNNKFYAPPAVNFLNGFDANCNADAGKNSFYPAPGK